MTNKNCIHKWKKLYYRKFEKGQKYQEWMTVPDKFICDKCLKIKELK
jgi:hypothetical protein